MKIPQKVQNLGNMKNVEGVRCIVGYIAEKVIPNIPDGVSEDTVWRKLIALECGSGGLCCQPRTDKLEPLRLAIY
jgi:hypothetical protein